MFLLLHKQKKITYDLCKDFKQFSARDKALRIDTSQMYAEQILVYQA
jgi:hypothetical protein